MPWQVPNQVGSRRIFVTVDSTNLFVEDNENDNTSSRRIFVRPVPPDRTPPTISNVRINNGAPVALTRNATVTFNASDPAGSNGATVSGVKEFCLVRYTYSSAQRRWVEEDCDTFRALPAANSDGSFTVPTQLRPRAGTAYVFVWVRDGQGNISRTPGFDVISFIPPGDIEIDRNETRVFRISLEPGQALELVITPDVGDVDVSVFQGVGANATRIAVSAENGTTPETVSFGNATASTVIFQVEVRAVVNSVVTVAADSAGATLEAVTLIAPGKQIPTTPIVAGPPAIQAAIDASEEIYLPGIRR